ncbi:hypothetical protein ACFYYB_31230 [Streptomyces sp. NPDC002886]
MGTAEPRTVRWTAHKALSPSGVLSPLGRPEDRPTAISSDA